MSENTALWLFNAFIVIMLVVDLGIAQRRAHFPGMREAILWTTAWVAMAVGFALFVSLEFGREKGLQFVTGYLVEQALSVDNVFVFIIIFTYFAVPREIQHRVLFWGVLSAIILRAVFIVLGSALVAQFHWILYLLGLFLIFTAVKLAAQRKVEVRIDQNPAIRFARRYLRLTDVYEGGKFFTRRDGKLAATPLFLVLLMIESTDIAFATDSIPAIFAITKDPFIIYTSNIFAVLGLRSLYFVVAGFLGQFRYLKYGLSAVLGFIGIKMIAEPFIDVPITVSLTLIFGLLLVAILLSVLIPPPPENNETTALQNDEDKVPGEIHQDKGNNSPKT